MLTHRSPEEKIPQETDYVRFVELRSELLSKFHGRPTFLRAGVVLPRDYDRDPDRRYPLRVEIGGYGTRYTDVRDRMDESSRFRKAWLADGAPRMVLLQLDGAGPYGDPYQVNSDNNGPYGDAVTQELIPYVEKKYHCIGEPYARVLSGASTGGWVSLALQVFYPDYFNGAWSHAPDPVDFRAYELINIYKDDNAYVNGHGFERPGVARRGRRRSQRRCGTSAGWRRRWGWAAGGSCRARIGAPGTRCSARAATTACRSRCGTARRARSTRTVLDHWKKYDLRLRLEQDWATLGPKLRGKLHIWVGEADDYFLNNAVHLLDEFLSEAHPAFEGKITYAMGKNHFWRGLTTRQMLDEMAAQVERGRKEKEAVRRSTDESREPACQARARSASSPLLGAAGSRATPAVRVSASPARSPHARPLPRRAPPARCRLGRRRA